MKIIDLLNNIINREKLPKKIIYNDKEYYLCNPADKKEIPYYINNYDNLMNHIDCFYKLNDEVKIIEENKSIEELKIEIKDTKNTLLGNSGTEYTIGVVDKILINKINELVKEVNKLKEE